MSRNSPLSPSSTLFDKTAHWFDRAKAALIGNLPCRQGCSRCCVGLFPVTILDQQEIQRGLCSLPDDRRRAIEEKASQQVSLISASAPQLAHNRFIDHWTDRDVDTLVERYSELPCPALAQDGSCSIYNFRPLTCRSMGIPSDVDGVVHGACTIQTSVPLIRLSSPLRHEEDLLAKAEAEQLALLRHQISTPGEEVLLPYAFLPTLVPDEG